MTREFWLCPLTGHFQGLLWILKHKALSGVAASLSGRGNWPIRTRKAKPARGGGPSADVCA